MAIRINDAGKVSVRVIIDTELTEDQIITAVAHTTLRNPEMGAGKYQRGSADWPKKAEIIAMIDDAVEVGAHDASLLDTPVGTFGEDVTEEQAQDAERRARNIIMRSFPDLLMG